jgi:phosphoribosylanthranilate isomerase
MRVKICGITKPDQGRSIAQFGATALGFICVPSSPRYVTPEQIREVVSALPDGTDSSIDRVGVFANAAVEEICRVVAAGGLNAVQLHGHESPQMCQQIRAALPTVELIKALRIRDADALQQTTVYETAVDALLLDAYHPNLLGGTGHTIDWSTLQSFRPCCPWILAGGLTPDNIQVALQLVRTDGIDLSSGVEVAPGDKDLRQVERLFEQLRNCRDRFGHDRFVSPKQPIS